MALVLALAGPVGAGLCASSDARASVSLAVTWEGLLSESSSASIVTPAESMAVWEDGRIYTYTRVRVDRALAGDLKTGDTGWVRTMGGVVGSIGQQVEGEPVLAPAQTTLLFLHPGNPGTLEVTGRGQGQYAMSLGGPGLPPRLSLNRAAGMLVPRRVAVPAAAPQLATEVLHGRTLDDAAREIASAWDRTHAR